MTNHLHLVAIPEKPESFARGLGQVDGQYAQWFNRRYRRSGHLWQDRFKSCSLSRSHLLAAPAYVDLNPARAGLVRGASEYEWSSAAAHCTNLDSDPLLDAWAWSELAIARDWAEVLRAGVPYQTANELRRATDVGKPFGEEAFVRAMEARLGRNLRRRKVGPRSTAAAA